jgi:hypothetical protein
MQVDILEHVSAFTSLGIRFWDAALNRPVAQRLSVSARPLDDPAARAVPAFRTLSGIEAMMGLPGLRAIEQADPDVGSPATRSFVVEVADVGGTFLPVAFTVDLPLPYRGLFLGPTAGSPIAQPGFLLFSAPQRRRPGWLAAVRGELALAADEDRPAAHAVVSIADPDGAEWNGIADAEGRFAVLLPWPAPAATLAGSPGTGGGQPLAGQSWDLTLRVAHGPGALPPLPGTILPDYGAILAQAPADLWADPPGAGSPSAPDWTGRLDFGAELTVRTAGLSRLLVGPGPASPPSSP